MIYNNNMSKLKSDISKLVGKKIMLKRSLGRDKGYEKTAIIEKTYPSIFMVKFDQGEPVESYSYADVLTRSVEVSVYDGEMYNPLLPPQEIKPGRRNFRES